MKTKDTGQTIHAAILLFVLAAPALAMEAPDPDAPEEIIVRGVQSLTQLKVEIELAQDRMFGLFNALNTDDLYDIHCAPNTRTGTLLTERECRPVFLSKSMEQYAKSLLAGVQSASAIIAPDGSGMGGAAAMVPQAAINHGYPILKKKMNALVEQNAEFADAVAKHHELIEEYEQRTSSARDE